jgi:signal transduction histidine kinase
VDVPLPLCISNGYGKQVPVTFEVSPIIYDTIITDEEWLWQMLLNLLTNACKYTDRGSIHVKVSLTTTAADAKNPEKTATFLGFRSSAKVATSEMATDLSVNTGKTMLLFEVADTGEFSRPKQL